MASREQIAARGQEIRRELTSLMEQLSEKSGVALPPDAPYARQPEFRANDELDKVRLFLRDFVAATYSEEGNRNGRST